MSAKTSRPDRKRGDRSRREPSEFSETTLSVDRVTRVVKGGRRMRFRAIVIVGNKKGKVGLGTGKASEVQAAVRKAASSARRSMMQVPIVNGTIPHEVEMKFKAAKIRLLPAFEGTGIIAGGALRVILEQAGVKNVLSKRFGTRNKLVNAQATMLALKTLRAIALSATSAPMSGEIPHSEEESASEGTKKEQVQVTEIDKEELKERLEQQRRARIEE